MKNQKSIPNEEVFKIEKEIQEIEQKMENTKYDAEYETLDEKRVKLVFALHNEKQK